MIWQSVFLMTVIDLLIVATVGYVLVIFFKDIKGLPKPWPGPGVVAIVAGLCLIALFYLSELLILHAFPLFMPVAKAMTAMEYFHLNHRWVVALLGVGAISLGFVSVSRTMTSTVKSLTASQGELSQALAAREETEHELRESERRLRAMAKNIPGVLFQRLRHPEGRISYPFVSEGSRVIHGLEAEAIMADASVIIETLHPEDRADFLAAAKDSAENLTPMHLEARRVGPDGGIIWLESIARPRRLESGAILWDGVAIDVTERKRAEEALRQSEVRFRDFAETASDWFWEMGENLRFTYFSDSYESGDRKADWRLGKTRLEITTEDIGQEKWRNHQADLEAHKSFRDFRHMGKLSDGRTVFTSVSGKPIFDDDGNFVGYRGTTTDFTERHRAEEALRRSERRLQMVVESAPLLLFALDREGVFTFSKGAGLKSIGYAPDELVGRSFFELYRDRPDMRDRATRALEGEAVVVHSKFRGLDLRVSYSPMLNDEGEIDGLVGVGIDISEQVKLEDQLRQAQKLETVGKLTGGVAHDFNNLLAVIISNLELLDKRLEGDAASRDLTRRAVRAAERGATLIQRLLAFSRKQALNPEVTDLNRLVPGMTQLLQRTLGETIEIEMVLTGGPWHTLVDRGQLESALLNLALNARDAMAVGGKLTIETANVHLDDDYASAHDEVEPGHYVMLAVSDTGVGMAPEVLDLAFEPFFTTKEVGQGSGLGLSMVYGFVKQSEGHIKVYSEIGHGTTAKIYLPRSDEDLADTAEATLSEAEPRGRGEVILVVEDDADVRESTVLVLSALGYTTEDAANAEEALAILVQTPEVALVFTDVMLRGGMSGPDLAREAQGSRPELKVLYTSGYSANAIIHHGRLEEGVELIEKPFRQADLARRLRALLDR